MRYYFIILLLSIIMILFYFIISGRFCHCSTIHCPNHDILRSLII